MDPMGEAIITRDLTLFKYSLQTFKLFNNKVLNFALQTVSVKLCGVLICGCAILFSPGKVKGGVPPQTFPQF